MIRPMYNNAVHKVEEVGVFRLTREPRKELTAGMVGYIIASIKTVSDTRIGDTITLDANPAAQPLPGFKEVKPVVFSSIYPISADDYQDLAEALEKYKLNDAALVYQKDASAALGLGFRCGFLGLLHLEIVQERLEREFDLSIIMTVPGVHYEFILADGREVTVDNPMHYPDPSSIKGSREPFIRAHILIPERFVGAVMKLCLERRGVNSSFNYPSPGRVEITFEMPLAEVIFDFYDRLKTITQGYGSFDYELLDYRPSDLVKLDILVNGEKVDALSHDRAPGQGPGVGRAGLRPPEGRNPQAAVQDRHPGGHRRPDHLPLHHLGLPQGRHRQVLRRRHHPETQTPGKTEGRQETHEDGGRRGNPPERLRGGAEDGGGVGEFVGGGPGPSVPALPHTPFNPYKGAREGGLSPTFRAQMNHDNLCPAR